MYLTNRDREIIKFVEEYGSITINQCSKIFFRVNKHAYYQARKRLKQLSNEGYLKRYRKDTKSEVIYYLDKKLSIHDLKVLDVYAELTALGAKIKDFKTEYTIPTGKKEYRADALIEFEHDGYFYPLMVEVDYTHFTGEKKLTDVYYSNYFQDKYKDLDNNIFPTILIVRPVLSTGNMLKVQYNVVYTDFNLSTIAQIL